MWGKIESNSYWCHCFILLNKTVCLIVEIKHLSGQVLVTCKKKFFYIVYFKSKYFEY